MKSFNAENEGTSKLELEKKAKEDDLIQALPLIVKKITLSK